mgnify:CR=1 FL=1
MKRIVHTVSIILAVLLAAPAATMGEEGVSTLVGTTFYAVIEEIRETAFWSGIGDK